MKTVLHKFNLKLKDTSVPVVGMYFLSENQDPVISNKKKKEKTLFTQLICIQEM